MQEKGRLGAALFSFQDRLMIAERPTLSQTIVRGLLCKCPRCGEGALYSGFLSLRPACAASPQRGHLHSRPRTM
ncbi:MAG: hypothetical protein EOO79_08390, partial [Oxalobacteraceae bacterium]